jgi:ppGpp synthetase/RelA/SpoT-type nucleotidyltranferase
MEDFIKEMKHVRKALEHAIQAADELPTAERTLKDLKEAQSLIESVIRRNKALSGKNK